MPLPENHDLRMTILTMEDIKQNSKDYDDYLEKLIIVPDATRLVMELTMVHPIEQAIEVLESLIRGIRLSIDESKRE